MQLQPATRVTAKTWKRKYATSEVTYYYTLRNSVDQHTTVTPGWSYTITADSNYATPAPMPADNGGWYNPRKRLSLTARKINALKRRQWKNENINLTDMGTLFFMVVRTSLLDSILFFYTWTSRFPFFLRVSVLLISKKINKVIINML